MENDFILSAMEEIVKEYGNQGEFTINGQRFTTDELLNELRNETQAGFEFRKQVAEMIITYLMKFRG